MTTDYEKRASV